MGWLRQSGVCICWTMVPAAAVPGWGQGVVGAAACIPSCRVPAHGSIWPPEPLSVPPPALHCELTLLCRWVTRALAGPLSALQGGRRPAQLPFSSLSPSCLTKCFSPLPGRLSPPLPELSPPEGFCCRGRGPARAGRQLLPEVEGLDTMAAAAPRMELLGSGRALQPNAWQPGNKRVT